MYSSAVDDSICTSLIADIDASVICKWCDPKQANAHWIPLVLTNFTCVSSLYSGSSSSRLGHPNIIYLFFTEFRNDSQYSQASVLAASLIRQKSRNPVTSHVYLLRFPTLWAIYHCGYATEKSTPA